MKQYRSSSKDCAACPLKSQCIGKSSFKTIAVTIDKEFLGMRRVNTKGVSLAGKCMMMAAIAYNLKKIMKWQSKKAHIEIKELRYSLQSVIFSLTGIIKHYYLITD